PGDRGRQQQESRCRRGKGRAGTENGRYANAGPLDDGLPLKERTSFGQAGKRTFIMKRCLNVLLITMAIPWLLRADGGVFDAIRRGDTTALGKRLTAGADPNATDEYGATALMNAAVYGTAADLRLLLDAGADVDAAN